MVCLSCTIKQSTTNQPLTSITMDIWKIRNIKIITSLVKQVTYMNSDGFFRSGLKVIVDKLNSCLNDVRSSSFRSFAKYSELSGWVVCIWCPLTRTFSHTLITYSLKSHLWKSFKFLLFLSFLKEKDANVKYKKNLERIIVRNIFNGLYLENKHTNPLFYFFMYY